MNVEVIAVRFANEVIPEVADEDKGPLIDPALMAPETVNAVNVPSEVILGCAPVTIFPLILVEVIAVRFASEVIPEVADEDKGPLIDPALIAPATVNAVNVPSEVMLGCAPVTIFP